MDCGDKVIGGSVVDFVDRPWFGVNVVTVLLFRVELVTPSSVPVLADFRVELVTPLVPALADLRVELGDFVDAFAVDFACLGFTVVVAVFLFLVEVIAILSPMVAALTDIAVGFVVNFVVLGCLGVIVVVTVHLFCVELTTPVAPLVADLDVELRDIAVGFVVECVCLGMTVAGGAPLWALVDLSRARPVVEAALALLSKRTFLL